MAARANKLVVVFFENFLTQETRILKFSKLKDNDIYRVFNQIPE